MIKLPPLFAALYEFRVPESLEPGSVVGVVRALDADIGENAEMDYRIISSDGPGMFDITTNKSTQDGVIVLRKVSKQASCDQFINVSTQTVNVDTKMLTTPPPQLGSVGPSLPDRRTLPSSSRPPTPPLIHSPSQLRAEQEY